MQKAAFSSKATTSELRSCIGLGPDFRLAHFFPRIKLARIVPGDFVVPSTIDVDAVQDFEVFDDDIWIVTPPKCGTTWSASFWNRFFIKIDLSHSQTKSFDSPT